MRELMIPTTPRVATAATQPTRQNATTRSKNTVSSCLSFIPNYIGVPYRENGEAVPVPVALP